ncbi:MAG TPA: hypothetical protein VF374_03005 [Thermoplasmata archaeon]|jgi:hypothetical protein
MDLTQEMSSTAILALIAAIAVVATGGIAVAANGYHQWHGPGGMMGGWPAGDGMMGGEYQNGDSDDYGCPMREGSYGGYSNTTGMPCWGANQTLS